MDKWQLIEITLKQLIQQWKHNKELFKTDSREDQDPTIASNKPENFISWEPPEKPAAEQQQLALVSKTVTITYSPGGRWFKCEISQKGKLPSAKPENIIIAQKSFIPMRSLYWDFMRLRRSIIEYKKTQEGNQYLQDLYDIFPGTLDNYILGGHDEED